jgi:hypothetical protein
VYAYGALRDPAAARRFIFSSDNGGYERSLGINEPVGPEPAERGWVAFRGAKGQLGFPPVEAGRWSLVAAVYNDDTRQVSLYVDGRAWSATTDLGPGLGDLYIGSNGTTGTGFRGHIDSAFVYADALRMEDLDFLRLSVPMAAAPVAGSAGYALALSGAGQHMVVGDRALAGNFSARAFSVEWWMRPRRQSAAAETEELTILYKGQGGPARRPELRVTLFQDHKARSSQLRVGLGSLDWSVGLRCYCLDAWVHVAINGNGTALTVLEGGHEIAARSWAGGDGDHGGALLVGAGLSALSQEPAGFFMGALDELRVWNIARAPPDIARDAGGVLRGDEAGLTAYWRFDEGRGAVAASAVVVGGRQVFGLLSAAYDYSGETEISDAWFWEPSHAPIADRLEAVEFEPLVVALNASDARLRPLEAIITAAPARGALYGLETLARAVDPMQAVDQGARLGVGDRVPLGPSVVYFYAPGDDTTGFANVTFAYRAVTADGTESSNEGVVEIRVATTRRPPALGFADGAFGVQDIRVEDVDADEADGMVKLRVSVEGSGYNDTAADAYVSLATTRGLVFDEGVGTYQTAFAFRSTLDLINPALADLTVQTRTGAAGKATILLEADDMGHGGLLGGPQTAQYNLSLEYRFGTSPEIDSIDPAVAPVQGGGFMNVYGSNLGREELKCVFGGQVVVNGTAVSPTFLRCPIPPHPVGLTSFALQSAVGYVSNSVPFMFVDALVAQAIRPWLGYTRGGTEVVVYGEGFLPYGEHKCLFGVDVLVPARYLTDSSIACESLAWPMTGEVALSVSFNGIHFVQAPSFTFVHEPIVVWAEPTLGSSAGNSQPIALQGSNFVNSTTLACRFGGEVTRASFLSPDMVLCEVPAESDLTGPTPTVSVALNGEDFAYSAVTYTYIPPARVTGVIPALGSALGGTQVAVVGEGFYDGGGLLCRFGSLSPMEATFVSSTLVLCPAPPSDAGAVHVEVSNNGADFTANGVSFLFVEPPQLLLVTPAMVSVRGGTVLTVYGQGFVDGSSFCVFSTPDSEPIRVAANVRTAATLECAAPAVAAGRISVAVAVNSQDAVDLASSLTVEFFKPPRVNTAEPSHGPVAGATNVTFTGEGFRSSPEARCRFGDVKVPAWVLSSTRVICQTPRAAVPTGAGSPGVAVELSWNDVEYFPTGLAFQYDAPVTLQAVRPQLGSANGGTTLTISASNLLVAAEATCIIGNAVVPAKVLSPQSLQCVTPPAEPGRTSVRVSLNGVDATIQSIDYLYIKPAVVESVSPKAGPSRSAPTTVTLTGSGFYPSPLLACVVRGEGLVPAKWISSSLVQCELPAHALGTIELSATNNGVDVGEASYVDFTFSPSLQLSRASPRALPIAGAGMLELTGEGIANSTGLACAFGGIAAPARYVSNTTVLCQPPSHVTGGWLAVGLLDQGVALSETLPVLFYAPPVVRSLGVSSGPAAGGFRIVIEGSGFFIGVEPRPVCRFSGLGDAPATIRRDSLATCDVPARTGGPASPPLTTVTLSLNGQDFSGPGLPLYFRDGVEVVAASPISGPIAGGTPVVITGSGVASESMQCAFGSTLVPAEWVGARQVSCVAPPSKEPGPVNVTLVAGGVSGGSSFEFLYYAAPRLFSIHPSIGAVAGGTWVNITGEGFLDSPETVCRFGADVSVPQRIAGSSSLLCRVPAADAEGTVAVEVSNNGVDFSASDVVFTYIAPLQPLSISPRTGPVSGNTVVRIEGTGFAPTGDLACVFGEGATPVPAVYEAANRISCVSPPFNQSQSVSLAITANGVDFVQTGFQFLYAEPLRVTGMSPALGPEGGGTAVTLTGGDFLLFREELVCEFGSQQYRVSAEWMGRTTVVCRAPMHPPGEVVVRLSNNGQQFVSATDAQGREITFSYHSRISLSAIEPRLGSVLGGVPLHLFGTGFLNTSTLSCRVGGTFVQATYVSNVEVICLSPAVAAPGDLAVEMSNNGVDFSEDSLAFTYLPEVMIRDLQPRSGPSHGGTRVQLEGRGFRSTGVTQCMFGSEAVPAVVLSDEEMECQAPAHNGSGLVGVRVVIAGVNISGIGGHFAYYGKGGICSAGLVKPAGELTHDLLAPWQIRWRSQL